MSRSPSLSAVAEAHTLDLVDPSSGDLPGACNPHSWFSGPFKCCYDGSAANANW